MRILIAGAGIVGNNLAEQLSEEGHDVSIIDEDTEKIRRISDTLDVMSVCGNACMPSILVKAGIRDMVGLRECMHAQHSCKSRNS